MSSPSASAASSPPRPSGPGLAALFSGFFGVGIMGFGGVLPLARRMIVEQRRWMTAAEFSDLLALCQFLPGGNIMNMAVAVGLRFRGVAGALTALVALLAAPTVIVIGLGATYLRYRDDPVVRRLFAGLAAAAAGLVIATAIKLAAPLRGKPARAAVALACFAAIALLRLPLLPTMLVLGAASTGLAWRSLARG